MEAIHQTQWAHRTATRLSEYAEALRERLLRHGFPRRFQLDEDAARQDKLTTWIEYLGYQYWWFDRSRKLMEIDQRKHDEGWTKLLDSNVLAPWGDRRGYTQCQLSI
jgi:hypothetical protein